MTAIEHGVPLAKLTTIGTGGPARALARPRTVAELGDALRLARDEGLDVFVVGLGSNVLAADAGVDGLVLRLEGELAAVEVVDAALRGWRWRDERCVPASRARRGPRWLRVRVRHPRDGRRWRVHERRRIRP